MKSLNFMMYVVVAILCLVFAGSVSAGAIRLHVERIMITNNGTSNGNSLSGHSFTKYYNDAATCTLQEEAYNAETTFTLNTKTIYVLTKAKCEAWNDMNLQ